MGINSPINITDNVSVQCNGLCSLSFDFPNSTCTVKKMETAVLAASYVGTDPNKQTMYNGVTYTVEVIKIYNKSLHRYNGLRTEAEMLIYFNGAGSNAGSTLVISVPIEAQPSSGSEIKTNGAIITSIIKSIPASTANIKIAATTEPIAVNFDSIKQYNLNSLIPSQEPFYAYIGNRPYQSDGSILNYVVFPRSSAIYVSNETITYLNRITTPFEPPFMGMPQNRATYNPTGANSSELDNDIYIDCAPTGSDGVQLYQAKDDPDKDKRNANIGSPAFTNFIESDLFIVGIQVILFGFVAIIIVFIGYKIFRNVSTSSDDAPEPTNQKGGGGWGSRRV